MLGFLPDIELPQLDNGKAALPVELAGVLPASYASQLPGSWNPAWVSYLNTWPCRSCPLYCGTK